MLRIPNMWMSWIWKFSDSTPVDFLDLCEHNVRSIQDLESGGNLLNQRQCHDLATKLSQTTLNIRELVSYFGGSAVLFRSALGSMCRLLEKAKELVRTCGEQDWCAAAVFQWHNENAFREILLDVSLCYNVIYEQVKSKSGKDWTDPPQDLRQSSVFLPTPHTEVVQDQQDLQKRLEDIVNGHPGVVNGDLLPEAAELKRCLARYLLGKLMSTYDQLHEVGTLDTGSAILWEKESEPSGTWGSSYFLGSGSGASGVCSTKWLGMPCAKKEFHPEEAERFFVQEALILAHLKHPHIINFFCCGNGEEKGDRFIAMELMEKSLFNLIQGQKNSYFSFPELLDIMVEIARGMWYLHDQGVAHRDLKPQNVVVNRLTSLHLSDHFRVKLVDFGMSKTKVQVSKSNSISIRGVGTTRYRAPEVYPLAHGKRKAKVDWFKADVFSFAMTCAHLLTLRTPFEDLERLSALYNELMNGRRPELPLNCPEELVALLRDCWNTVPCSRPTFKGICTRLEILRHKLWRGFFSLNSGLQRNEMEFGASFAFINKTMEEQSFLQRPISKSTLNHEVKGEAFDLQENSTDDVVSSISCTYGHALRFLSQLPDEYAKPTCNMCFEEIHEDIYHCETCQFGSHPHCVEMKDKVEVFFHDDPLHLLIQNYHKSMPGIEGAICRFCEGSLDDSEWVYRCDQCDFDAHALCTRYPKRIEHESLLHPHLLTLIQCPPRKSLLCIRCNGEVRGYTWRYTCTKKWCEFDLHPSCALLPCTPLCVFESSHRLSLIRDKKSFHCGRCGALGFSWFYHCNICQVDIHLDCITDTKEGEDDWNMAYKDLLHKDDHSKVDMISELLNRLLISNTSETSPSSSTSPEAEVTKRVQPKILRRKKRERPSLNAVSSDMDLQREIATVTTQRIKLKKTAATEARQKLKAKSLEMLENLQKVALDLQNSQTLQLQADAAEATAATLRRLEIGHQAVQEGIRTQEQSMMRRGPRIAVFYFRKHNGAPKVLLSTLQADMEEVRLALLCEEPGHEHIVPHVPTGVTFQWLLGEQLEKLQPLLVSGLQVVRRDMISPMWAGMLRSSVRIDTLGSESWDLRSVYREDQQHGKRSTRSLQECEENAEALKRDVDAAAEWLRRDLENHELDIFKWFRLGRVRYTVTDQGSSLPRYTRGSLAWLCTEHQNLGLQAGTLESYPMQVYHNLKHDKQSRMFL